MTVLLEMENITKLYGTFAANQQVSFSLRQGEIHAIVGENGAGKTTLMRMLYGMEKPTDGTIRINGEVKRFDSPADAIKSGIGMVHQHFMLFPTFTVAENIVISQEPAKGVWFDRKKAAAQVKELSEKYRMSVDPHKKVWECTLGMQQRVEILKVLYHGADIVILDEPTAVLTPLEVKELLVTLKHLAQQGKSVILITHKLHEVMEVADRITVLRGGQVTGTLKTAETNVEELSRLMVGRDIAEIQRSERPRGDVLLAVNELFIRGNSGKPLLDRVSFRVHAGEIVGIAGVSGNGQSELIQVITGLRKADQGDVYLLGQPITNAPVRSIRQQGMAHIPEDRYLLGAAKDGSIVENAILHQYVQPLYRRFGLLRQKRLQQLTERWVKQFAVKTNSLYEKAQHLSGGNLQKLIAAREIGQETPFLLAAEPTRGVDIGAMEFIHAQLLKKREQGDAILLVSSELSEVMALSDRILVMYEGRVVGELDSREATEEAISLLMAGGGAR
ncbi:ABC transporter ATP-binding protein [Brevibacillus humidisoli]|uniref:ABC transporter ATP-binding protein n=1 Tax=Brevibacillus humidisoli TaxID=2895522 RepID=UPI001E2ECE53|nr:ABC transporter ATP-binding protein [Brevibacillus humidisoli]UFJ39496.1 ABC transporter ATP-binding protein [Brevibacillus humidisoli]